MKAKNSIDLFELKIAVVADSPDDWSEMKLMKA